MRFLNGDPLSHTLALIKPDAVLANQATDILDDMGKLFVIADVVMAKWTPGQVSMFYAEHEGKAFFPNLVKFMSSAPMFAVVLVAPDAVAEWREQMGETSPNLARVYSPHSFRARYAADKGVVMHNVVHGSDSLVRAELEVAFVKKHIATCFGDGLGFMLEKYKGAKTKSVGGQQVIEYPFGASEK